MCGGERFLEGQVEKAVAAVGADAGAGAVGDEQPVVGEPDEHLGCGLVRGGLPRFFVWRADAA